MSQPQTAPGSAPGAPAPQHSSGPVQTRKTNVGGKPFSSRNVTVIGAIGLALIALLLWASFNANALPLIGGGTTYSAAFTEDAGLVPGNEVRVAGVKVGAVTSTSLNDKGQVIVKFKIKNNWIGDQSKVDIKLKTLLGTKYVSIDSMGSGKQDPKQQIPISRTTSPFDVYPAFTQLTNTVNAIDTNKLSQALTVLTQDFSHTSNQIAPVLNGLQRLSGVIASKNLQLQQLVASTKNVTGVLAQRNQVLAKLITDGGTLLGVLNQRRDAIHSLLVNTGVLTTQLEGLVSDNQKKIGPMLANLKSVVDILQSNEDAIDRGLQLLAPYYRIFNNVVANGRWFDNQICNLSVSGLANAIGAALGAELTGGTTATIDPTQATTSSGCETK